MNAVPVRLGYEYAGLGESEGLLRDEGEDLVLEYQPMDSFIGGLFKSSLSQARIPREAISTVTLQKGWLGLKPRLIIQAKEKTHIADLPGLNRGRLVLAVARRDRPAAEKFVAEFGTGGPP